MYFPGARLAGIFTRSLTALPCQSTPWQEGHGGSKPGSPQLAQRLQSEPGDSGHGWQEQPSGPISPHWSKAWLLHECGVEALSPGPGMQHGPRPVGGTASREASHE